MTADFLRHMHRFILQHEMIEPGETVIVAVSGGADSLALLYALHALCSQLNCRLHVAHLNHCLRPDADADAAFVQQHAAQLELPCTLQRVEVPLLMKQWKLSVEAAARKARYQFFEDVSTRIGATKVALGHHQDDTAETVLMNLIRGSGSSGLKGIAPVREGKFIRPLAGVTREQIEGFLTANGLVPRYDLTNADVYHLRNRVRHELIPRLECDYNPNIKVGLRRTADVLAAESEYLDTVAQEAFEMCRIRESDKDKVNAVPGSMVLDRVRFRKFHIALKRRILRKGFFAMLGNTEDLSFTHCEAMLSLIDGETSNGVCALPKGLRFRRDYQYLIFERAVGVNSPYAAGMARFAYPLVVPGTTSVPALQTEIIAMLGGTLSSDALRLPDGKFEAIFDYEKLQETLVDSVSKTHLLTVRNRRHGDRFQPYGMRGTKKIKDFFIDAKVPRYERDRTPMLVCGDEILWVVGYTTGDRFKIQPGTRQYLYLRYVSDTTVPRLCSHP